MNLADAVGGGAAIATDLSRHQKFQSFGYPGKTRFMKTCASAYIGDDLFSTALPGPPTLGIHCHWPPGSSGGGWLIDDGTQIDGVSTYFHLDGNLAHSRRAPTYSPYFCSRNRRQAGPRALSLTRPLRRRAGGGSSGSRGGPGAGSRRGRGGGGRGASGRSC